SVIRPPRRFGGVRSQARTPRRTGEWAMIVADNLRRVFVPRRKGFRRQTERPEKVALAGLTMSIDSGELHGLLGPHGAGQPTFARILSTVLTPTSGTATVNGYDVVRDAGQVRRQIGIVFGGDRGLYGRLSPRQNLRFWGAVGGLSRETINRRTEQLLERVG